MVWYGMVWYGMVWYGMVWYGMVWYGMVWYGMVWYGMVWYDVVELLVEESTMSSFAVIQSTIIGHQKQCYGIVKIDIFRHQQIQDLTGNWL